MFALSLPAVKSFKSGLPISLHLRFFSLGVMGAKGGYCLADVNAVFIFCNHIQADCRVPRVIGEVVRIIYSCPWCRLF